MEIQARKMLSRDEKRRSALYALIVVMALSSSKAFGDWQWTKWGMTMDDVLAASEGKAVKTNDGKLRSPYSALGMEFTSEFIFSNAKLSSVELRLDAPTTERCGQVEASLKDIYGAPLQRNKLLGATLLQWRDDKAHNRVYLFSQEPPLSSACSIQYQPMASGKESGL